MANALPLHFNIENRPILIFGGGSKAAERIRKLLPYAPALTVAAERVTPSIKQLGTEKKISLVRSNGSNAGALIARLKPVFVIIADVEPETARDIFKSCRKNGTEVHTVDQKEFSTFGFPSVIRRKNFSVAVSVSEVSPDAVKWILEHIERSVPAAVDSMLGHLGTLRQRLTEKASEFKQSQFATMYREFLDTALRENRMLSAGEMAQIMGKYINEA